MAGVSRYGDMFSNQKHAGESGLTLSACRVRTLYFTEEETEAHIRSYSQSVRESREPDAGTCALNVFCNG